MLLFSSVALAACTFDASTDLLATNIDAAEKAYVSLDVKEFQRAMTEVDYLLPCLIDPVPPELAASLHRIRAIGQYVDDKPDAVRASLQAARILEPSYEFSTDVLPEGFELRELYASIDSEEVATRRMPRPTSGTELRVDGRASRERPERATLLQVTTSEGVQDTRYLLPGDPLPEYPGVDRSRNTLLTGALVTGGASLALYGGAWISHARLDRATNADELRSATVRTHALTAGSAALVTASLAQVGALLARGRNR